jgi:hypothetical protein
MGMSLAVLTRLLAQARPLPTPEEIDRIYLLYRIFRFLTIGLCAALAAFIVYVVFLIAQGRILGGSTQDVDAEKVSGSRRQRSETDINRRTR